MAPEDRFDRQTLISFVEGTLPADTMVRVEHRLATDGEAARFVQTYRTTRDVAASDDMLEPSAAAIERGIAIFDAAALPARPSWMETLERVLANLIFDSRVHELALRHTAQAECVELTFEVGATLIDLRADRLSADGLNRWRIMGQVDGQFDDESVRPTRARLVPEGTNECTAQCPIDEDGVFTMDAEAGTYEIWLEVNERGIVMRPVVLK